MWTEEQDNVFKKWDKARKEEQEKGPKDRTQTQRKLSAIFENLSFKERAWKLTKVVLRYILQ